MVLFRSCLFIDLGVLFVDLVACVLFCNLLFGSCLVFDVCLELLV